MLMKKLIAIILTALMLMSTFTFLVQAEGSDSKPEYTYNTKKNVDTMNYLTGQYTDPDTKEVTVIDTEDEKIALMDLRYEANGYRIYIDERSGEVAVECIATGDRIFTNPVNASASGIEESKKKETLSQILISYVDIKNNEQERSYNSYADAVDVGDIAEKNQKTPNQLVVKPIKNGIRVEYSIGRVDSRYLVPERISKVDFEEKIKNVILAELDRVLQEAEASGDKLAITKAKSQKNLIEGQLGGFFKLYDLESEAAQKSEVIRNDYLKRFPMVAHTPIYAFTGATNREYRAIEALIKKYCPDYTYEDLDNGHLELDYEPMDRAEALFNVSLEYQIEETYEGSGEYGLTVRLPANGIRFDESSFRLSSLQILPYMGASLNPNPGYTFFPDGTGTLFDAEELSKKKSDTYFYGTVYGDDFAYSNLGTGAPHNEIVRYPVYGVKETQTLADGTERDKGFTAVIEEGDALTKLISYHTPYYNTIRMEVNPRPSDTYSLSDAISVSGLSTWTVVSPRKYTGDFKIRYFMLTDEDVAKEKGLDNTYAPDYVGMAKAYRDYLVGRGVLTKLTEDDVKDNIPLYIETFGCTVTTEKFLSIPYDTEVPLTSFGDIQKMYSELSEKGVSNINFIMSGYTKGGLKHEKIPYGLNWDKAVEKELKFEELLADAKEKGYGLYPDFDFVFCSNNSLFDGLSLNKHAIKTIDDRYTSKREYSATRQTFINYFELAMSPAYFSRFYTKLTEKYTKLDPIGIAVSTLGSYLSSDFDEDEPYNREDSKQQTAEAFEYLDSKYNKVLTSGGNAFSWKYVDYITDASIDSSRHARSCATVPFLGIVLHGYVEFAGSAINMEGNIDYALLRTIENGASLKFILSYRNTEKLKKYYNTSIYYSVRYDIWFNDLVERYLELNKVLKDLQTSEIVEHIFIDKDAIRIPDAEELDGDAMAEILDAIEAEKNNAFANREELREKIQSVRKYLLALEGELVKADGSTEELRYEALYNEAVKLAQELDTAVAEMEAAKAALDALLAPPAEEEGDDAAATVAEGDETAGENTENDENVDEDTDGGDTEGGEPVVDPEQLKAEAEQRYNDAVALVNELYVAYAAASADAEKAALEIADMYSFVENNFALLEENNAFTADIVNDLKTLKAELVAYYEKFDEYVDTDLAALSKAVSDFAEKYVDILVPEEEEDNGEDEEADINEFNKYAVSINSVVYEKFENGVAFVLNFNNYDIKVLVDGSYYTVEAYGYIVIK